MPQFSSLLVSAIFLLCSISLQEASIAKYPISTLCDAQVPYIKVSAPFDGYSSSGILVYSTSGSYSGKKVCTVTLEPPKGVNLILSIRKIDLRSNCKDNVTVLVPPATSTVYCGSIKNKEETKTHDSNSTITVTFKSGDGFPLGYSGFEFVFTSFYNKTSPCGGSSLFRCENRNCISSLLTCDGHNHCGDRSDQKNCGPSGGAIAGYVLGSIFLIIALVAGIVYCTRRQRRVITTTTTYPPY